MCKINGRRLGEIRENAGMSQRELGEKIGVTAGTISHYENGDTNPSDENVKKICMILKITEDDVKIQDIGYSFVSGEGKLTAHLRKQNGFKRYLTPSETEEFVQEKNTKTEEEELKEVAAETKYPQKLANKAYVTISPTLIHIPTWQRNTDMAKANEISQNYSEEKFEPIKVYIKSGKLYVADGAHRLIAMILKGEYKILVELIDCGECKAIEMFLGQQIGRKTMTISDMYRAAIENKVDEYIDFKNFMDNHNIQISVEEEKIENPLGVIRPTGTMLRRIHTKEKLVSDIFDLIKELNWCGSTENNPYTQRVINVLMKLYSVYGKEKTETKMMEKCKGVVYFDSKVFPIKSNAELFDMLSDEISKNK